MRHHKIQKSNRHKKLKTVNSPNDFNFVTDTIIEKMKDQQMPKKLAELMKYKQNDTKKTEERNKKKELRFKKKYKTLSVKPSESFDVEKGMTRIPKKLPVKMEKGISESDGHFMNRLNRMVAKAVAEANIEEHFDVDFGKKVSDPTDESTKELSEKDLKQIEKKKKKNQMKNLRKKARKIKKQTRFIKQLNKLDEFPIKKDNVKFGERVDAPPQLNFKKP